MCDFFVLQRHPNINHCTLGAYARLGKTWDDTPSLRQDRILSILKKRVIKQAVGGRQEKAEILAIPNRFKDTLDDLVDSSNDSSDTEPSAILRQVDVSSDDIPGPGDSASGLEEGRDISKNGSQRHHQRHVTPSSPLGGDPQERTEALGSEEGISEVSVYHPMIYGWVN